jgi:hypothetical protein
MRGVAVGQNSEAEQCQSKTRVETAENALGKKKATYGDVAKWKTRLMCTRC